MYEYSTTTTHMCLFIPIRQRLCRGFFRLIESKEVILRFHFRVLSLTIIFIKDIAYTAMHASCSDLYLEINSEGRVLGRHFTTKEAILIY